MICFQVLVISYRVQIYVSMYALPYSAIVKNYKKENIREKNLFRSFDLWIL